MRDFSLSHKYETHFIGLNLAFCFFFFSVWQLTQVSQNPFNHSLLVSKKEWPWVKHRVMKSENGPLVSISSFYLMFSTNIHFISAAGYWGSLVRVQRDQCWTTALDIILLSLKTKLSISLYRFYWWLFELSHSQLEGCMFHSHLHVSTCPHAEVSLSKILSHKKSGLPSTHNPQNKTHGSCTFRVKGGHYLHYTSPKCGAEHSRGQGLPMKKATVT